MAWLKEAKEEVKKEIVEYRAQTEAEFQKKVAESSGDLGANVKRLERRLYQDPSPEIRVCKDLSCSCPHAPAPGYNQEELMPTLLEKMLCH